MVQIEFRRLRPEAQQPRQATSGSSGFDLHACVDETVVLDPGKIALVPTGLAVGIPEGYEGQVRARSGLALKHGIIIPNGPGTIDSDYRGPLGVILANLGDKAFVVNAGDRIAQLVVASVPQVTWVELDELPETARAEGGFGHTGV